MDQVQVDNGQKGLKMNQKALKMDQQELNQNTPEFVLYHVEEDGVVLAKLFILLWLAILFKS